MKARYYVLTFVVATALGVYCRHGLPALARASWRPGPGTPAAAGAPAEPAPFAAAPGPGSDAGDLLLARIARDCGDHLLARAGSAPGDARLLNQAAHHYRACLAHAPSAGEGDPLFAGARRSLARVEGLLAEARPAAKRPVPAEPPARAKF